MNFSYTDNEDASKMTEEDALVFPLSFGQKRLWFLDQLEPGNPAYNAFTAARLVGQLNLVALEQSLNEIVRRHEVLRTTFAVVEEQPSQIISVAQPLKVLIKDLRGVRQDKREMEAQHLVSREAHRPFDLVRGPLFRTILLCLNDEEHILLLVIHHIIFDEWSSDVLKRELAVLYGAFSNGQSSPLPELPIQYADFTAWQQQWLQGELLEKQLAYWKQQLGGSLPMLELPIDRPRPALNSSRGASHSLTLTKNLSEGLKALSRRERVTLFMTLLAAFKTLLYRYSGQEDIIVGSPITNHNRPELEGLIGFFLNTLALRTNLAGNPSFRELLGRVRAMCLGAYAHQDLPFEKLVEELRPSRDLSRNPLFQVAFSLHNFTGNRLELPGLIVEPFLTPERETKFDLTLHAREESEGMQLEIVYNRDLFDAATIIRMLGHFRTLLEGVVANVEQHLSTLPLLTPAESYQMLMAWNATQVEYLDLCLHQLFEAQVERTPDAVAIIFENKQLTYRELNMRANQLAHHLQTLGVKPEVRVGIFMERSLELVVGLLGILKAGGSYVPLDPEYPQQRLAFMVQDAQAPMLLTQQYLFNRLPVTDAKVICLGTDWEAIAHENKENLISGAVADNLAYVIYTSGSTGRPKGAMNTHRGICNRLLWGQMTYRLTEKDCLLLEAPFSFDASVWELFWPLQVGAKVILVRQGGQYDSTYLVQLIARHQVTIAHFVPSMLRILLEEATLEMCMSLRHIFCGGEVLPVKLQERCFTRLKVALHNQYGPTEAAANATYWDCRQGSNSPTVPIGRPIANTQIYLLDTHLQPVPIGVPGELYIGGVGLARGYLNHPELTAERFIPHPFSTQPGARLYKTGDVGRYLPNGAIEFLGRIDHQVKIRGVRIELEEVEAVLRRHPDVQETVVVAREDTPNEKRLVAYVVPHQAQTPTFSDLRSFLKEHLPAYMIPAAFVLLDALPLTPNGKVDRQVLPAPDQSRPKLQDDPVTPRDVLELQLVRIWEDILNVHPIGVTDSFFDLGGHSLLAVRLMLQIQKQFGQNLPLATLLQGTTIEHLASILRQGADSTLQSPLVGIQPGGSKRPLFFVHPAGGGVLCYVDLARSLGSDQPFYGLQALGLDREREKCSSIEDMAAYYIAALRALQPQDPYLLGGWSLGGVIAFEMAQQLQRQRHTVALLALLDSRAPVSASEPIDYDDATLLTEFAMNLGGLFAKDLPVLYNDLQQLEPDKRLSYILEQARKDNLMPQDTELLQIRQLFRVFRANIRAVRSYTPLAYPGRVTLFRASERPVKDHQDSTMGWSELAAGGVELHMIPGNHYTIVRKPHIQVLAQRLKDCLDKAQMVD